MWESGRLVLPMCLSIRDARALLTKLGPSAAVSELGAAEARGARARALLPGLETDWRDDLTGRRKARGGDEDGGNL